MALAPCRECGKEVSDQAATCPHCGVGRPVPAPRQPRSSLFVTMFGAGVCIIIVLAAIAVLRSGPGSSSGSATASGPYNPDAVAPAVMQTAVELIHSRGYMCPALSYIRPRGDSPHGPKYEVYCGPDDGTGNTNSAMHYAVYPLDARVNICGSARSDMGNCS